MPVKKAYGFANDESNPFETTNESDETPLQQADRKRYDGGEQRKTSEFASTSRSIIRVDEAGDAHLGKFKITNVGVVIDDTVSESEWMNFLTAVNKVKTALQWIVADWAAFGSDRSWGSKYHDIARETGYSTESLTDMVYVARSVHFSVRTEKLTFTHHKMVAALAPETQKTALDEAVKNKWNVRQFRQYLEGKALSEGRETSSNPFDFKAKKRDFGKFLAIASKAGQGDAKARRIALGWITEQKQWLQQMEDWLQDVSS